MSEPIVLVADDDDDILLLVTTRLRRDGFEVISARNGEEALALAKERRPAIAVLDIGMPGLDGLEVLERIRADADLEGTRVLLLTAKAQESDVRRGYDSGADAYVRKPFSPADLSARVRELLDGT
ncbi:MAG TPA: response regulator [Gaiellaceae bacterium]|jgi:DNA-binding response OmpR family regulator|nr:response regulator [Gaiellaceae bacterium]